MGLVAKYIESRTHVFCSIAAGVQSIGTRSVAATTQTAADGSFSLNNIPAGTYTLYASSRDSLEQAVAIGVTVRAGEVFDAGTLRLTPVGNISGRITVDGSGGMGFLVSVAGTSFMAVTNTDGDFLISGIPVGNHHVIVVSGNFTRLLSTTPLSVSGGQTTPLGTWDFTSDELIDSIVSICPDTGNWLIDGEDTGIPSQGPQGPAVTIARIRARHRCAYLVKSEPRDCFSGISRKNVLRWRAPHPSYPMWRNPLPPCVDFQRWV